MEKNVVSFVFKMTTKTQRGHYYMIKILKKEKNKKTFYKIGTLILLFVVILENAYFLFI